MPNSFNKAVSPLLSISHIIGLGRIEYPPGRPRLCLNLLCISVLWIGYCYAFSHVLPIFTNDTIHDRLYLPRICFYNFVVFTSTFINLCNEKKFQSVLRRIAAVDTTIESLGIPKDYSKLYKTTLRTVRVWLSLAFLTIVCSIVFISCRKLDFMGTAVQMMFVSTCAYYVNNIVILNFGVFLDCIGTRLDRVNERIQMLADDKENKRGSFQERLFLSSRNPFNDAENKRVLWIAMHLHFEICKISRELNSLFEIQVTLQMISLFIVLITEFVYLYRSDIALRGGFFYAAIYLCINVEWVIIAIVKLYYVNNACESANSTKGIMDKAMNTMRNNEDRKDMMQFILQMVHKPLKFTGMGFFYFGHDFMRRMLLFVSTVAIIMLQMDIIPNIQYNMNY